MKRKPEYRYYKGKKLGPYGPYSVTIGRGKRKRTISRQRAYAIRMKRLGYCGRCGSGGGKLKKTECDRCVAVRRKLLAPQKPMEA